MGVEWLIWKALAGKGAVASTSATKAALATKGAATSAALAKGGATGATLAKGTATNATLSKGTTLSKASSPPVSPATLNKGALLTKAALSTQLNHYGYLIFNWVLTNGLPLVTGTTIGAVTVWQLEQFKHDQQKEDLTQELANAEAELQEVETKLQDSELFLLEQLIKLQAKPKVALSEAEPVSEKPVADNLKRIRGIGIVFSGRLNEAGIFTFAQLAETDPERIREIVFINNTVRNYDVLDWIAEARQLAGYDQNTVPTAEEVEPDEQRAEGDEGLEIRD